MQVITRQSAISLGLKRYFTANPCPHGHTCERYVSTFGCVDCASIKSAGNGRGYKRHFVPDSYIFNIAHRCESYGDFRTSYPLEYLIASRRKILPKIKEKLGLGATSKKWCNSNCKSEANKYISRSEFATGSSGAYDYALKNGIMDECCEHMIKPKGESNVVYMWGGQVDGRVVVKVGVTSKRLGKNRLDFVIGKYSGPIDFVFALEAKNARKIEKSILSAGGVIDVGCFNGSTEFRSMTWDDVGKSYRKILRMAK